MVRSRHTHQLRVSIVCISMVVCSLIVRVALEPSPSPLGAVYARARAGTVPIPRYHSRPSTAFQKIPLSTQTGSSRLGEVFVQKPNVVPNLSPQMVPAFEGGGGGGGGGDWGGGGRESRWVGHAGKDGEEMGFFAKVKQIAAEIKYHFKRVFDLNRPPPKPKDRRRKKRKKDSGGDDGGDGGKKDSKKDASDDGKNGKRKGKLFKPKEEDEDKPDPKDGFDERNWFLYRMGWTIMKNGKRREWWVISFCAAGFLIFYESFMSPWLYYMKYYDLKPTELPHGSQIFDMKQQERQTKSVQDMYKGLGYDKGTTPRATKQARKAMKGHMKGAYSRESLMRDRGRFLAMRRNKKAMMMLARYCVPRRGKRRYKRVKVHGMKNKARRCAFFDILFTHPYFSSIDPEATEVRVKFPSGTYVQKGTKTEPRDPNKPGGRKKKGPIATWSENLSKSIADAWTEFRVNVEYIKSGEYASRLKMRREIREYRRALRKDKVQDHNLYLSEARKKYPESFDKEGKIQWPLTEYEKDPNYFKDPEWDQYLLDLKKANRVPHGSRPQGSKPYLECIGRYEGCLDPSVY
ncbi:hypothetical protein AAMO2058_000493200 [Amorphochlora amoebiformis]